MALIGYIIQSWLLLYPASKKGDLMSLIRFTSAYYFRLLVTLLALSLSTVPGWAQSGSQGTVTVTVVDSTAAVVAGADLELRDLATNDVRKAVTQDKGLYTFVNLPVGTYKLTVSKTGFDTASLDNVRAQAAQVTDVSVVLKIGVTTQVVEIHGESAPLIDTTSSAISTTIDIKQIEDLPLAGRDLTGLSYLVPGYTGAFSGLPSIAEGNNIDGIIGSPSRMKFTGNSQAIVSPRLEDIQEMTVQTDQLDLGSGYGQANTQINYVTRRGTNSLHVRVYEDFRNTVLNANSWINNAQSTPGNPVPRNKIILNDFGGSIGGSIIKDKLFYFGSFSTSRQPGVINGENFVLAPGTQQGAFTYTDTTGTVQTVNVLQIAKTAGLPSTINPMIATQLQAINAATKYGALTPNGSNDPNLQDLTWQQASPTTFYYPTVRVDYNISQKFRVNFAWNETKQSQPAVQPAFFPGPDFSNEIAGNKAKNYTAAFGFDWTISPTLINQFRGGMLYNSTAFAYNASKAYVSNPAVGWNYFSPTGGNFPFDGNMSGQQFNTPISTYYPLFNASDTVAWQHAAHTMSFGFSFYREQDHYWNGPLGFPNFNLGLANGDAAVQAFTTTTVPNADSTALAQAGQIYAILTGRLSGVNGQFAYNPKTGQYLNKVGAYNLDELSKAWGLYFQDSYRIKPTLTVNYGLRWDFTGDNHDLTGAYHGALPADVFGPSGVGNLFNPGSLKGTMNPVLAARGHQYDAWNVSPQPAIGLAWNPQARDGIIGRLAGGGQTVIRAGFSLRKYTEPYQYFWNNASDYGNFFYQNFNLNASNTGAAGTFSPGSLSLGDALPPYLLSPAAYEKVAPESEFTFLNSVPINGMDPHIQQPYTQSWNLGIQRALGRNSAIEVRYVGSRSPHQWISQDINEVNIFAALPGQPSFLQQFVSARKNLQICLTDPTCKNNPSFANQGLPGQVSMPIFDAAFAGESLQNGGLQDYTNTGFITDLNTGQAGALASVLTTTSGNANYFCNLVGASFSPCVANANFPANNPGAGYPINFFQANPYGSGGQLPSNLGPFFTGGLMHAVGWSDYHGLQVDFRQRQWHGLQFDANYTWSHTLGTATANQWQGVTNQFTVRSLRKSYGPTLYDLRHVVHVNGTYDLPLGKGKQFLNHGGPLDRVLGGWTVGSIFTFHTGLPVQLLGGYNTFNDYGDGGIALNGLTLSQLQSNVGVYHVGATHVDFINPTILQGLKGSSAAITSNTTPGTLGWNPYLYGPHFVNFDIAGTKNTAITERFKLKFQAEFLNAFNHPNFGLTAGTTSIAGSPTIRSTRFGTAGIVNCNPNGVFNNCGARQLELRMNLEF
jgi:hypothetical protein